MDTYYLGTKVTVVLGAAGGDDFIATADTLVTGDVIRGGIGTNTLTLQGAGSFNLNAFFQIVNVQFLDVQEGAGQTVYLRNGLDLEVDAASPDPSDPGGGITIYGARNADVIKLGSGNDTVYLGDARESVYWRGRQRRDLGRRRHDRRDHRRRRRDDDVARHRRRHGDDGRQHHRYCTGGAGGCARRSDPARLCVHRQQHSRPDDHR